MRTRIILSVVLVLAYAGLLLAAWSVSGRARQDSRFWSGTVSSSAPAVHALPDANQFWLEKINDLRLQKNLRKLKTDSHLRQSAETWAKEMKERGEVTHERLDGKTMHQWIAGRNIPFTEHGPEGWKTNYFVENIARYFAEPSITGLNTALDKILGEFLSEGPGGDHYESIFHPDWNAVGVGYAVEQTGSGVPRIYFVFHYGSLKE